MRHTVTVGVIMTLLALGGMVVVLGVSCREGGTVSPTTTPAGKVVNVVCPIMGTQIDPAKVPDSLTREYKGQKVGFCCGACPAAWDKLSDAEKDAKLKACLPKR